MTDEEDLEEIANQNDLKPNLGNRKSNIRDFKRKRVSEFLNRARKRPKWKHQLQGLKGKRND